jgi:chromosome partitioning protein
MEKKMIYATANEKGGVGKTTIAFQIALHLAKNNRDVLLVDADIQASATDICLMRSEAQLTPTITCISLNKGNIAEEIRKLSDRFDDVVIDVGGRDTRTMRSTLLVAEKVIIPVLPAQIDAWALESMDELICQARGFNSALIALIALNNVDSNPRMKFADSIVEFATELKNCRVMKSRLTSRVAHRRVAAEGKTLQELSNPDIKAIAEFSSFMQEVSDA